LSARGRSPTSLSDAIFTLIPVIAWQQRITNTEVVREIDGLLDDHTYLQIASILNDRGLRSGENNSFTSLIVARIRRRYGLMSRYDRLRTAGMLTVDEMTQSSEPHHNRQRYGIAMGCFAVMPTMTTMIAYMSIRATLRRAKPRV
jgi:hypothetical protein